MDKIIENVLNSSLQNTNLINEIYLIMCMFFESYIPNTKINSYIIGKVSKTQNSPHILVLREITFGLVRQFASYKTKIHNNGTFYMVKITDSITTKLMICFSIFYYLDCVHSKIKNMIGIDFEFNSQKIALCQVGFYPKRKFKYVFVFNPKFLSTYETDIVIKTMFTQQNAYKIMHGSDSLDIPYIFEELFMRDSELIIQFTKYLVDTRFLCEYYKISTNWSDKKCSLYDALKFFNVITLKKYEELENINKMIGPIYDVKWNVKNMSSYHLKYAGYDVVYLKLFVLKIFETAKNDSESLKIQCKYVSPIYRLHCYERYKIVDVIEIAKNMTDPVNNYIVESKNGTIKKTMINIFNEVIENAKLDSLNMSFKNFTQINNFKKILILLFKLIVYSYLSSNYIIYSNKKEKYDQIIQSIDFKQLHLLKLHKIVNLLEYFNECLKSIIINSMSDANNI
jgi:hypothetical protein